MINPIANLYAPPASPETTGDNNLNKDAFMQLLVAQMKNQDPTEPTSNEQFIAQLAQFSSLEEMQGVNENLVAMAALNQGNALMSQLTNASTLIGNNVTYTDEYGTEISGEVEAVRLEGGQAVLQVDGATVPLSAVSEVTGDGESAEGDSGENSDG
ncbi:MAG: flagellar hook capping FlgD N-terminal domain-containing protein [Planctomycetota bacterium]|nr:flagellar hook capping FlgD N-terminal domain-containing protein [Planctomycetota bacterium]